MLNLRLSLILIAVVLALVVAMLWPAAPVQSNQNPAPGGAALVIVNGTLLDGSGAGPVTNGVVVVVDGRIVAAGPATAIDLPAQAQVIDAAGGTIMPGIINTHVHNTHPAGTRQRFLAAGVTATCDMATKLTDMAQFEQSEAGPGQAAARGFKSGPMITAPEGYPSSHGFAWDYQVADPAEARAAVEDLVGRGADMIKVALEPWQPQEPWPVLGLAEVRAVVETAHQYGLPVRAHVQQATVLDIALDAGVDVIEHTPLPFQEELKLQQLRPDEKLSLADYPELDRQLRRMAEQGTALVPTLNVGTCATHGMPGLETKQRQAMCQFQLEIVGRFQQLGGVVALGNDYGNPGVERGMPVREMELLLAAGLSPLEVIEAGTRHAAQVCGQGSELGTLQPGKLADIIIVDGNPLEDMTVLEQVKLVIKEGQVVYGASEL
jgi:imidazolonepropionase-like amidohydrolase